MQQNSPFCLPTPTTSAPSAPRPVPPSHQILATPLLYQIYIFLSNYLGDSERSGSMLSRRPSKCRYAIQGHNIPLKAVLLLLLTIVSEQRTTYTICYAVTLLPASYPDKNWSLSMSQIRLASLQYHYSYSCYCYCYWYYYGYYDYYYYYHY